MNVIDRFLRYVSFDTQSDPESASCPSSGKQKLLAAEIAAELSQLGLQNAHIDEHGYVYGWLPATPGCEGIPCMGLIAHMDTSPAFSGANVKPRILEYTGGDVVLDPQGKATHYVIGVGGFLGMGEHDVAIPFAQLHPSNDRFMLQGYSKDQLKELPKVEVNK